MNYNAIAAVILARGFPVAVQSGMVVQVDGSRVPCDSLGRCVLVVIRPATSCSEIVTSRKEVLSQLA